MNEQFEEELWEQAKNDPEFQKESKEISTQFDEEICIAYNYSRKDLCTQPAKVEVTCNAWHTLDYVMPMKLCVGHALAEYHWHGQKQGYKQEFKGITK